jgi:hypothetical protein
MTCNMRGDSKFGCLLSIALVAVVVYAGFKWGYAQWDYESMKEAVGESAKFFSSQTSVAPEPVRQDIIRRAAAIGLELYDEDVEVVIEQRRLTIDVYWETPLEFPGYTYYIPYHISKTVLR